MKRLLLAAVVVALFAVPAALADGTFSGTASALQPFTFTVTAPAGATLNAAATFDARSQTGYTLAIYSEPGDNAVCRTDAIGSSSSPLSCSVQNASGTYRVAFWTTKGKKEPVSVAVTGSS